MLIARKHSEIRLSLILFCFLFQINILQEILITIDTYYY